MAYTTDRCRPDVGSPRSHFLSPVRGLKQALFCLSLWGAAWLLSLWASPANAQGATRVFAVVTDQASAGAARPAITSRNRADPNAVAVALGLPPDTMQAILAHGPWPQPFTPDPGNRASGQAAAVALGGRLFFDRRLSHDGRMACASCHLPEKGFSDGRVRSLGHDGQPLDRNAQGLLDARLSHWFGWDGAADSLWAFSMRPLNHPRELALPADALPTLFERDAGLACLRQAAFGSPAGTSAHERAAHPDERLRVQVAKALAAYVETLDSGRTRFDDFRDALARGDLKQARAYPADALRGLQRFVGEGRCYLCHTGPAFSQGECQELGRPFLAAPGRPDPGRHGGIQAVLADPYNRLGPWVDAPAQPLADDPAVRTRHLSGSHRNFGEFKVPGLRGAVFTAPYFHDGSAATLSDVVAHYSTLDSERLHADGEAILKPLQLTPRESADLVAFLRTLSQPAAVQRPGQVPVQIQRQPPASILPSADTQRAAWARTARALSCPPPARAAP